jgi:hypothetical protein
MSFADASGTRLAFVAESTENTIPASPSWQNLRFTSESLNYNKQTVSSEEIRADRNVSDMIDVGFGVGGEIGFELSYGTLDSLLESLLFSTWSTNVLKNGITPKSFAFEKTFETGATDQFMRFSGCQMASMSLAIAARERITGTLSVLGMGHSKAAAALSGATYTDGNTNAIMAASGDVGSLSLSGVSPNPTLMSVNLNIENNLREQIAIGNRGPVGIGAGRCVITGSLEAYFEDLTLYNAFYGHDDVGISMNLGSVSGSKYTINLPKTKLTAGTINAEGNDQDVMASFDFQAIYDSSGSPAFGASMSITRAVS